MKILTVNQIREGDNFTIKNEPIKSIDLMERAASKCFQWIIDNISSKSTICIFAGIGNNGGDGLAIARHLAEKSYTVKVYVVEYSQLKSEDFKINLHRIEKLDIEINTLTEEDNEFNIEEHSVIIDSIFGSGLNRPIEGFTSGIIEKINSTGCLTISIDIASGLIADTATKLNNKNIIIPNHTLSLAFPKIAFFLAENEIYVGKYHNLDIGIHTDYKQSCDSFAYLVEKADIKGIIKGRSKFAHKGTFGHSMIIAGSTGKIGAAILASKAALRSGIGLLTVHIPKSASSIIHTAIPEAMVSLDSDEDIFTSAPETNIYNSFGVGPGIGMSKKSEKALKLLIQNVQQPMIIDADALNIISENKTWLSFLPQNSILTPHPKEFDRIAGKSNTSHERIEKQKKMSCKHGIYIVLKGAYTSITTPDGKIFFNSTGNPGMATAGSGDVLTGIITSLLAQNYNSLQACILGVYVHGLAGDFAALQMGFESLIASDIIDNISNAFIEIHK